MSQRILGKITQIKIGNGGYQDGQFGISFTLEGRGCGCGDFWGAWGTSVEWSDRCKWTEADRRNDIASAFWKLALLMKNAKVDDAAKLKGVPVEIVFDNNRLESWRILTEVL